MAQAKPSYTFIAVDTTQGVLNNQNVPGAVYDTESGFVNSLDPSFGDNPTNALTGNYRESHEHAVHERWRHANTGIVLAGKATQGTRLVINFSSIPNGSYVSAPNCVNLVNVIGRGTTGIAVLVTNTSSTGFGGQPVSTTNCASLSTNVAGTVGGVSTPGFAVYEVFFANPNALEKVCRLH